jgi:hypothetical protein
MVPDILKRTGSTKPGPKPSERSPVLGAASRTDSAKNLSSAKGSNSVRNLSGCLPKELYSQEQGQELKCSQDSIVVLKVRVALRLNLIQSKIEELEHQFSSLARGRRAKNVG